MSSDEGVKEVDKLRLTRRQCKAAVTREIHKIERLIVEDDVEAVKQEELKLKECFSKFEEAHENFHKHLEKCEAIDQCELSDQYFFEVQNNYVSSLKQVKGWLRISSSAEFGQSRSSGDLMKPQDVLSIINLPKIELEKFDGNPVQFHAFMTMFDECVDSVNCDSNVKLTRLLQYTEGKAKEAIRPCILTGGESGYRQARRLLQTRFGDDHLVTERIIRNLRDGKPVRTPEDLQVLSDELQNAYSTLHQMGKLSEIESQAFILQVVDRLQAYLRNRWRRKAIEKRRSSDRYPVLKEFVEFIEAQSTEANDPVYGQKHFDSVKNSNSQDKGKKSRYAFVSDINQCVVETRRVYTCVLCKGEHKIFSCEKFRGMTPPERVQFAFNNRLCENCLLANHRTENCKKPTFCSVPGCAKKHSKFLHVSNSQARCSNGVSQSRGSSTQIPQDGGTFNPVRIINAHAITGSKVHMPVVAVNINGSQEVCALLDTASSNSLCSKSLVESLKIHCQPVAYSLSTLTSDEEEIESRAVNLRLSSLDGKESLDVSNVYIVDSIPIKSSCPDVCKYSHFKGLQFVAGDQEVHLLLGQDNAEALVPLEIRRGIKGDPFASRTMFGWSINGPDRVGGPVNKRVASHFISATSPVGDIDKLWRIENEGLVNELSWSREDEGVMRLWDREVQMVDSHYQLPIPWKENATLTNNITVARSRLKSLLGSLHKKGLFDQYQSEVSKLFEKGNAERVPDEEIDRRERVWYLPHQAVFSDKKPGKMRVVFDCASKHAGESLNDKCFRGPDLNNRLCNVLLRFRQHAYAFMGDIESMYHQVRIPLKDRDALRFLWIEDNDKIVHCRMTSHLFGGVWCAASSTYALRRVLVDFEVDAVVRDTIMRSFYVDDCLCSFISKEMAINILHSVAETVGKAGFHLTKFVSNDADVTASVPPADRAKEIKDFDSASAAKALGLKWDVQRDSFYFTVVPQENVLVSKRIMLSYIASMFDPLGLVNPFLVTGKLLLQDVTRLKLDWDEVPPSEVILKWESWVHSLQELNKVHIPRCIKTELFNDAEYELHHFSDASLRAYGSCSYIRCVNEAMDISVMLISSKCKVAPLKCITIPRLELQAAVLSARMDAQLRAELDLSFIPSFFWTDSEIVLKYVKNDTRRFMVFVENRVSVIRSVSEPSQWYHVAGRENPADLLTKSQDVKALDKDRWFVGPEFLRQPKREWRSGDINVTLPEDDPEVRKDTIAFVSLASSSERRPLDELIHHYSSWYKLKRVTAWFLRFRDYLRGRINGGKLTVEEIVEAETSVIRYVQMQCYSKELNSLSRGEAVPKSSAVRSLCPQIGTDGLLRVGGRLRKAASSVNNQPILIPHTSPIARCIALEYHNRAHLGTEWVVSILRKKFWITKVRVLVKGLARDCMRCKRLFAPACTQLMADLPAERLEPNNHPFTYTGIDCFGPFMVKQGRSQVKRYGCLFTCMSIRAIHLEKLCSLDTDSFLNALRRFIARRGNPARIFCDNGTNFVGGSRELKRAMKQVDCTQVHEECLKRHIEWNFNPPGASHMGGVWERLVRTVRKVLLGITDVQGSKNLPAPTDEVLETLMCEVEAIINGRPLTKTSDDPTDSEALTPNHFLMLSHGRTLSPGEFGSADAYRKRWRFVQHLVEQFWKKWLREYIPELQRRSKWVERCKNVKAGDLILIVDENTPRNVWPLGLVIDVHESDDGLVRSVKIKTKTSTFVRPITKIVMLEGTQ